MELSRKSSEATMGQTGMISQTMVKIVDFTGRFSVGNVMREMRQRNLH